MQLSADQIRQRVIGDEPDAKAAAIMSTPGPRWFDDDRPIRRVHADASMFVGGLRAMPAHPVLAGVLFGLMTVKPQLGVLIPFFLLATGAWRTIAAACATAAILFAVSAVSFGLGPWHAYFTDTTRLQWSYIMSMSDFYAVHMMTPYAALWSIGVAIPEALKAQWLISAAIVLATVISARSQASWPLKSAILAIGTVLAVPYSLAHDLAIPFAALVWYLSSDDVKPGWPLMLLVGALWMLPFPLSFILQIGHLPLTQVLLAALYLVLIGKALKTEHAIVVPGGVTAQAA